MGFADGGDSTSLSEERAAQLTQSAEVLGGDGLTINLGAPGSGQIFNAPIAEVGSKSSVGSASRNIAGGGSGGSAETGGFGTSGVVSGQLSNVQNTTLNITSAEGAQALRDAIGLVEDLGDSAENLFGQAVDFVSDQFGRVTDFAGDAGQIVTGAVVQGAGVGASAAQGTPVIVNGGGQIDRSSLLLAGGLVAAALILARFIGK